MQRASFSAVLALADLLSLIAVPRAGATTIATFSDPSDGSMPMFNVDLGNQTIEALWATGGLTLQTVAGTFTDVLMAMPMISFDGNFTTGPGFIQFSNPDPLLRIDFSSAQLNNPFSFGATAFMGLNEISFSGPVVDPPGIVDGTESFSFAFANQTSTPDGYTATAAFTSSGQLVPEPSSVLLLAGAMMTVLRRRR